MTRTRRQLYAHGLGLALALGPSVAAAQPWPTARAAFEEGLAALEDDRFAAAAVALEASYRQRPVPVVLYNLGIAYRGLGRNAAAIDAFERYLSAPENRADPGRLAALRNEVNTLRDGLVVLTLRVNPGNARLLVDGRPFERDGEVVQLDPGLRMVELESDGYRPWRREFTFAPGAHQTLDVRLELARSTTPRVENFPDTERPPILGGGTPPPPVDPPDTPTNTEPAGPRERSRGPSWVFWTGVSVAAASATASTLLWLQGNSILASYQQSCRTRPVANNCAARFNDTVDRLSGQAIAVNIGWAVAGLGTVVALVDLLARSGSAASDAPPPRPRWTFHASPSHAAVSVTW